jgi:hypothetical protein
MSRKVLLMKTRTVRQGLMLADGGCQPAGARQAIRCAFVPAMGAAGKFRRSCSGSSGIL